MCMKKILLTGAAGFIGMHVAKLLLERGDFVIGVDNLNSYYDPRLKHGRLKNIEKFDNFKFFAGDIADSDFLMSVFSEEKPTHVINLAAQAGVRYSLENPQAYFQSNLIGFGNVLEACRKYSVKHLVYASSSSVYGANREIPFSVKHNVDHPVSLYAATKKANELMAHSYSHLFGLPTTGLRYFTVYGPWGRPDMAPWLFTSAILENRPINVFNNGKMMRDFTYIDDIAEGTVRVLDKSPLKSAEKIDGSSISASSMAPYKVYNIGNNSPVKLMNFIELIESSLGKKAIINYMPMQPGDVEVTYADIDDLKNDFNFEPRTSLSEGVVKWSDWYLKNKLSNV